MVPSSKGYWPHLKNYKKEMVWPNQFQNSPSGHGVLSNSILTKSLPIIFQNSQKGYGATVPWYPHQMASVLFQNS